MDKQGFRPDMTAMTRGYAVKGALMEAIESYFSVSKEPVDQKTARAELIGQFFEVLNEAVPELSNRCLFEALDRQKRNTTIHGRLKTARIKAGFDSGTQAAATFMWPQTTYCNHENGSHAIKPSKLRFYAEAFNVSLDWLLTGEEPSADAVSRPPQTKKEASHD